MERETAEKQLETANALVERAKARLAGMAGVHSVIYSLSGDAETLGQPVLVVYTTGDVGDLSEHSKALGIPLRAERLPLAELAVPERRPGEKLGAPDPILKTRGDPPLGGYRVSGPSIAGTLGSVGYLNQTKADMAFVSAAHVFKTPAGTSNDAWQPLRPAPADIIGQNPVKTYESIDILLYPIILGSRAWVQTSEVYSIGEVGAPVDPVVGAEVRKVGQTTGLTKGRISLVKGAVFVVSPDDPSEPLSMAGDSGALWVNEHNRVVGIHQKGTDTNLAIAVSLRLLTEHGSFLFY